MNNFFVDMLSRLKNQGVEPFGFLDVGAHFGESNRIIRSIYPDARVFSFEANPLCESTLKQNASEYLICLLGKENKEKVQFFINPNDSTSTGCSIYKEKSDFFCKSNIVELPMYRLDEIVPLEANMQFLKIDVQGAEIDVIEGAAGIMQNVNWIYLEASLVPCNEGAPLFSDVFNYLQNKDYHLVDICDETRIQGTLIQANFLFKKHENNTIYRCIKRN